MGIKELQLQQEQMRSEMLNQIQADKCLLKQLADDMAECATNIQGYGYVGFVQAREKFFSELDRLSEQYSILVCPYPVPKVS